jgi:hypothetical protein
MPDRDQAIRDTLVQIPVARVHRRKNAITAAHALIRDNLGRLDEAALRRLLELFNQDMNHGREVQGRFKTGLVGRNANLLVASLANVNEIVPELWRADDAWLTANLVTLRRGGRLPGGGWLFLSMVLHARDSARFVPLSWTMAQGLAALDGLPVLSLAEGGSYLEYCRRAHALMTAHGIDPHVADVLLVNGSRLVQSGKSEVPDDDEPEPLATPVATPTAPAVQRLEVKGPAPATSVGKPASFGWLHLTDLHQGMGGASWLWPNVRAQLFADLERMHKLCGPWDLVFFTGDLTQRGTAEEFGQFDQTLEQLWVRFDRLGSRPQLIAVPGNHDLVRPRGPFDPVVLALDQWHEDRRLGDYVLGMPDNPYLATMRTAFASYSAWEASQRWCTAPRTRGLLPGDVAFSLSVGGIDVGVIGLNSAFLQLAEGDFQGRLDIDPRQLHEVCGHDAPEWTRRHHVNFLLTHHPPSWLAPRARQEFNAEIDMPGRFAAHLCGHMHDGISTATSIGGGATRLTLQGASLFGLEEYIAVDGRRTERRHGYSAGRVELTAPTARMRMYPRRMIDSRHIGRRIDRDQDNYLLDEHGALHLEVPLAKRPG